ncbi:MAG TPA: dihydroneopterin aldolase [Verrucomicrobiae bacterium]|nr:dihydroneopterin aldolase [Verrucomicrobiae bacterium]
MSRISIVDFEVFYCVGLGDEERANPQRLLVTVDLDYDFSSASVSDRIEKTINYQTVADRLLKFGTGRSWKLIEKVVASVADMILAEFRPQAVTVELKKFTVPQARYVSVTVTRSRPQ